MEDAASILISFKEGKIEIKGSEKFVKEQIENFKDLIVNNLEKNSKSYAKEASLQDFPPKNAEANIASEKYPNVLAFDEDQIRILKSIPGNNNADKMVNTGLLYLLGKELICQETATSDEIRKTCKDHACLDAKNFSSVLKRAKEYFIVSGSGKRQTVKLTHPGKTKATELITELNK